jgi:sugar phosphate isomerase/epimerase
VKRGGRQGEVAAIQFATGGWKARPIRAPRAPPKDTKHASRSLDAPVRQHRLTVAQLDKIQHAGIPAVEIFCARQHLDYRDRAQIAELGHWFRDSDLKLHSLHAPMYNDEIWGRSGPHAVITITEPVKGKRLEMVDEIKRALEIAETIPFKYMVQHIGVSGEEFDLPKPSTRPSRRSSRSAFSRASAAWKCCWRTFPTSFRAASA